MKSANLGMGITVLTLAALLAGRVGGAGASDNSKWHSGGPS